MNTEYTFYFHLFAHSNWPSVVDSPHFVIKGLNRPVIWTMVFSPLNVFMFLNVFFVPQMLESQVEVRQKEVEELQGQSQALSQEGKGSDEVDGQRISVETKFQSLQSPLQKRRDMLMASREIHQFNRDVEDEIVSTAKTQGSFISCNVWMRKYMFNQKAAI